VPCVVPCRARSPTMRRPPWPPRCLFRRLARRCKWLGESLLHSSSFWYLPHRVWCTGSRVRVSPVRIRRAAAVRRRPAAGRHCPATALACMRPRPPDLRSTAQIKPGRNPLGPVHHGPVNHVHHPVHSRASRPSADRRPRSPQAPESNFLYQSIPGLRRHFAQKPLWLSNISCRSSHQ
jgi:hypothetical protein